MKKMTPARSRALASSFVASEISQEGRGSAVPAGADGPRRHFVTKWM